MKNNGKIPEPRFNAEGKPLPHLNALLEDDPLHPGESGGKKAASSSLLRKEKKVLPHLNALLEDDPPHGDE